MKIIALYPVGNNEFDYLNLSLQSLNGIVDEIVVLIDYPFFNNKKKSIIKLLEKYNAKIYYQTPGKKKKSTVDREYLFQLGRERGGTHFICIDCDEFISHNFMLKSIKTLNNMQSGEKIMMRWLSAWGDPNFYRDDKKSVWSNMWKDFIVCDDINQSYKVESGYHEPRTIGDNNKIKYLNIDDGCVIHLQFVDKESFHLKQIYYSIHDYLINKEDISKINRKYFYSFFNNFPKIKKIPDEWVSHLKRNDLNNISSLDHSFFWKKKILRLIKKHDLKKFQNLNIWNNDFLNLVYLKKVKKKPRISILEVIKLYLFYIKSTFFKIVK